MAERKYPHPMPADGFGASLSELAEDTARLVRLEFELLKQELFELLRRNAIAAGMLAGAAVAAFLFLVLLQVLVIVLLNPHWAWAAAFTILWLIVTVALALVGKSRLKLAGPAATIQTIKDDLEWVKQQLKPAQR